MPSFLANVWSWQISFSPQAQCAPPCHEFASKSSIMFTICLNSHPAFRCRKRTREKYPLPPSPTVRISFYKRSQLVFVNVMNNIFFKTVWFPAKFHFLLTRKSAAKTISHISLSVISVQAFLAALYNIFFNIFKIRNTALFNNHHVLLFIERIFILSPACSPIITITKSIYKTVIFNAFPKNFVGSNYKAFKTLIKPTQPVPTQTIILLVVLPQAF